MPKSILDLTGHVYGRLTVLSFYSRFEHKTKWRCICECGNFCIVPTNRLRSGNTKSCGCLHTEIVSKLFYIHGKSYTLEHQSWTAMIQRCTNKNNIGYSDYGGRGIEVCERWFNFENFYEDMGPKDSPDCTIERDDPNGDYEPENCYWLPKRDQNKNTTRTRRFTVNGEELCLTDIAKKYNIDRQIFRRWLKKGYSIEEIINGSYKKYEGLQ